MGTHLTDKIIKRLPPPLHGNKVTFDSAVPGFGCRVTAAGSRAFVLNYRTRADGRERRYTIGGYPDWSVGAARDEARRLKRAIDGGADPVGELQATRSAPTVGDLCDRFIEDELAHLRPSTADNYRARIRIVVRPRLGKFKVAAVTFADIQDLHRWESRERGAYTANRTTAMLSKMFGLAVRWGWRNDNPAKGIERNQEHPRQRYLDNEELARFMAALAADKDQQAANILRLLLLTGARKSEVLTAKWEHIDLKAGIWVKPHWRTKQKREHRVPLSAAACMLLTGIKHDDPGGYVFAGRYGGCRAALDKAWRRICKNAGLVRLRIHDLRHSYASHLASNGIGLHVIGALLGHSNPTTTHRYAHLLDDSLRAATERVGAIITGKAPADVVPLKGVRRVTPLKKARRG
jgi:integrase